MPPSSGSLLRWQYAITSYCILHIVQRSSFPGKLFIIQIFFRSSCPGFHIGSAAICLLLYLSLHSGLCKLLETADSMHAWIAHALPSDLLRSLYLFCHPVSLLLEKGGKQLFVVSKRCALHFCLMRFSTSYPCNINKLHGLVSCSPCLFTCPF